ncbi:MAG: hypothetical protein PHP02_07870 [Eubacteriales bacterium]|nr:hypothetical protein [Eubacteriales bacterium]
MTMNHGNLPEAPHSGELNPAAQENSGAQELIKLLRANTEKSKVTGKKELLKKLPGSLDRAALLDLLSKTANKQAPPELGDISHVEGQKDTYYYDQTIMTVQYARLDALIQDKDIMRTVAAVVRSDSKLYPRVTPFKKLTGMPFWCTEDELLGVAARMKLDEAYQDIRMISASNGVRGFFSLESLSETYAQSLFEMEEVFIPDNP